jgi:hypothetical protein
MAAKRTIYVQVATRVCLSTSASTGRVFWKHPIRVPGRNREQLARHNGVGKAPLHNETHEAYARAMFGRSTVIVMAALFSSMTGDAGAVGEWILTFNARDQSGPVAGVCFAYSFLDPTLQQTFSGTSCTGPNGSNNVAFGSQVQAADVTQGAIPAGCTGGLAAPVHVVAGTPSVDAVLSCGVTPPPPGPPPPPPGPPPPPASNLPPIAVNNTYGMSEAGTLNANVLKNDRDPDGDVMHVELIKNEMRASRFSLSQNGALLYRPRPDFDGTVHLQYQAVDARGAKSETATVTVRIVSTPPVPKRDNSSPKRASSPSGHGLKGDPPLPFPTGVTWYGVDPFTYGWYNVVCTTALMGLRPFIYELGASRTEYFQMFVRWEYMGADARWHEFGGAKKTRTPNFKNDAVNHYFVFPNKDVDGANLLVTPTQADLLYNSSYRFGLRWEWLDEKAGRDVIHSVPAKNGVTRGNDFYFPPNGYCTVPEG